MKQWIFFLILFLFSNVLIGEDFKGVIIDKTGAVPGASMTQFTMKIEKYTSDEDVSKFAALLAEKGPDALVDTIHSLENGRIKIGTRLSYPLGITRTFEKDGKRVVRAVTDRPIAMIEALRNPRSKEYQFGVVEIVFEPDGKGQGSLVAASKIQMKNGQLEIESFGLEPFRLTNVTTK